MKRAVKCIASAERLVHTSLPALFHDHVHAGATFALSSIHCQAMCLSSFLTTA